MSQQPISLRYQVRDLYKRLLFLGREYPLGYSYFRPRLKKAFLKNRDLANDDEIKNAIGTGEYVVKELEALYYLKKYRTLKRSYY
ncbi:14640_t:CDS:2 [Acaulospora morrowiae]|uniref:14640_t:CDS:1 n=1 Tax=Acaulospora morrowiae TaxID=94023 RepID=A0A9N9FWT1_9GLOM|nr:14640_t:CDS:2 [Acaulospora morrowiae]